MSSEVSSKLQHHIVGDSLVAYLEKCSHIWGEHMKLCAGSTRKQLIYDSFKRHPQRLTSYLINIVLGGHPLPIAEEENLLPKTRIVWAQLRSAWSNRLISYGSLIDINVTNSCPACSQSPRNTHHLFRCPATNIPWSYGFVNPFNWSISIFRP